MQRSTQTTNCLWLARGFPPVELPSQILEKTCLSQSTSCSPQLLHRRRNTPVKKYILPSLRITATIIKIKLYPTSNLHKNLCNNLRNNLALRTASLISSNSYLFLHKHLTSFRRFSVEGDFKTPIVPKVAIEVATSVIQTGSSHGGYREERVI